MRWGFCERVIMRFPGKMASACLALSVMLAVVLSRRGRGERANQQY